MEQIEQLSLHQYQRLLRLAQRITGEQDIAKLCDDVLSEARALTQADGGTLYLVAGQGENQRLDFAIVQNRSLKIHLGGGHGGQIDYPSVPLYQHGQPNHHHVASYSALTGKLVNLADVSQAAGFDFSGTKAFDERFGYHTQSILSAPLISDKGELVGVLQLLNGQDEQGANRPFSAETEAAVQVLAGFAAVAILQQRALHDQKALLIKLAGEPNTERLLSRILMESQALTGAEGGTLYLLRDQHLEYRLIHNPMLGFEQGQHDLALPPIALKTPTGKNNHAHIAAHAALSKQLVRVDDAYAKSPFDFSGSHAFDKAHHYRTISVLAVPLLDHDNQVIGVLQLINARNALGKIAAFSPYNEPLIKALASYAAIALNNLILVDELKNLLDAFIKAIARAIDAKSPHTSGHCQRVPLLTELIAKAACEDRSDFADFHFDEDQWYELHVAAWLHDCGKLATPDSVLDKSTKLHGLYDRIHHIEARFACLRQELETQYWRAQVDLGNDDSGLASRALALQHERALADLAADLAFLQEANLGKENMSEASQARVRELGARTWLNHQGQRQALLSDDEIQNLCISRGTLNAAERQIINHHMQVTIEMLESLPFPRKLKNVPEYAGGHHERMDGKGFPRGLTGDQLSIPARMMAIADIFEALTAKDRPYKPPMPISQALSILKRMSQEGHIDPQLYALFVRARVWETYAKAVLAPEQLDVTDGAAYL